MENFMTDQLNEISDEFKIKLDFSARGEGIIKFSGPTAGVDAADMKLSHKIQDTIYYFLGSEDINLALADPEKVRGKRKEAFRLVHDEKCLLKESKALQWTVIGPRKIVFQVKTAVLQLLGLATKQGRLFRHTEPFIDHHLV